MDANSSIGSSRYLEMVVDNSSFVRRNIEVVPGRV